MVENNTVTMDDEEVDSLDVFNQDSENFLDSLEPSTLLKEKFEVVVGIKINIF